MATQLINTTGLSKFSNGTDAGAEAGRKLMELFGIKQSIKLTDDDPQPILKSNRGTIDVIRDFSWYAGPRMTNAAIDKIPCAFIQEREQMVSSLATGAAYYLNAASRVVNNAVRSETAQGLLSLLGDAKLTTGDRINLTSLEDLDLLKHHNLKSLEGIYFTRKTDFKYRLPIYGNPSEQSSSWGYEGGGMLREIVDSSMEFGDNLTDIKNLGQPGVYVEKPRYFTTATEGKTEQITFPLSNTIRRGDKSPIQENYELLWLLMFNNKPYKTSFGRTPPPKIYSVTVPGRFAMPYAYVSNLSVEFVGTTRNVNVFTPTGTGEPDEALGSKQILTPIPEAYNVTIEFTSLLGSYGNEMLSDAFTTSIKGNTVTIGKTN